MKLDFYLKRNRLTLKTFVERNNIKSYESLLELLADLKVTHVDYDEAKNVFRSPESDTTVEERTVNSGAAKTSNKSKTTRKTSDGPSPGGSKAKSSKSSGARRGRGRKKASNPVEPVRSDSNTESGK